MIKKNRSLVHKVYFNGEIIGQEQGHVSVADRGFLLADGLFETMKIVDNKPMFLKEHLDRLSLGAKMLEIDFHLSASQVQNIILDLIEANHVDNQDLCARLTLTRGVGPRGLLPPKDTSPTLVITLSSYPPPLERPHKLIVASHPRNEHSVLSQIKSLAYTDNILGTMQAVKQGADDAVFLNTQGFVACTSMANIFIVENNVWVTPPIADGALPGIMRAQILKAKPSKERSLTLTDCLEADAVYVCNSLMGVRRAELIGLSSEPGPCSSSALPLS